MVKIGHVDDSSLNIFWPQASPEEGSSQQQKENQRKKGKGKNISKVEKPKAVGYFLKILISAHAWAKMSWTRFQWQEQPALWCCKCIFHTASNHQNVKKDAILAKGSRCQWFKPALINDSLLQKLHPVIYYYSRNLPLWIIRYSENCIQVFTITAETYPDELLITPGTAPSHLRLFQKPNSYLRKLYRCFIYYSEICP